MKKWTPWEDVEFLSLVTGSHSVASRSEIPDYPTVRSCSAKILMSASEVKDALESGDLAEASLALVENLLNTIVTAQECGIPIGIVWDSILEAVVESESLDRRLDKEYMVSIVSELYGG